MSGAQGSTLTATERAAVEEWLASPERVDEIADYMMDARMDGPWWKPPSTLTYQEAMRHYARGVLEALLRDLS